MVYGEDPNLAVCNAIMPHREQNQITNIALLAHANRHGDAERGRERLGIDALSLRQDVDKITGNIVKGTN